MEFQASEKKTTAGVYEESPVSWYYLFVIHWNFSSEVFFLQRLDTKVNITDMKTVMSTCCKINLAQGILTDYDFKYPFKTRQVYLSFHIEY